MSIMIQILAFLTFLSFELSASKKSAQNFVSSTAQNTLSEKAQSCFSDTLKIVCDSIYKNKGYKITLITFDKGNEDESQFNSVFILEKLIDGKFKLIFRDSIYCKVQDVKFEDYNNDKVKDILVQNYSDVRSNLTYYLYLVEIKKDKLKRIRGFEDVKNPNYLPKYNLIDNYVMSGRIWTSFYKIVDNRIKDFNIIVYDDQTENGAYGKDYKKALKKILAQKNNR